jgi:DNA invertase Pin-like site-specific DNA recombinase
MGKPRALIYARVSTEGQATEDKTSLDEQLLALRKYAAANSYEVAEEIQEDVSGRKQNTEGLRRIRNLAEAGKIDLVLVYKWNRLARTVRRFEDFMLVMKVAGVDVISLDGQSNKTSAGRLMNRMLAAFSEYQRDDLVETMQQGKRGQARKGNVVPGRYAPYGFEYDRNTRTYKVDEDRMAHVRRIFRMVGIEGHSLGAVQREFQGVKTTGGGSWHRSSFRDIILNDIYRPHTRQELESLVEAGNLSAEVLADLDPDKVYGIAWYNRHRVEPTENDQHITTERPREEHIAVPVDITDARLDADLVAAAREAIQANVRPSNAGRRPWELKGFAYCRCGSRLTAHTVTSRRGRKCQDAKFHRAEALEQQVRQYALNLIRNPEIMREQVEEEAQRLKARFKDTAREARRWQQQMDNADAERDRLIRGLKTGRIDDAEFDFYAAEVSQTRAEAETELNRLRDSRQRMAYLDDLPGLVESYLKDLPYLMETRSYKLVWEGEPPKVQKPPKPYRVGGPDDPWLHNPPQKVINQEAEAGKWRGLYEDLGLKVVVPKDGSLEISWGCKSSVRHW